MVRSRRKPTSSVRAEVAAAWIQSLHGFAGAYDLSASTECQYAVGAAVQKEQRFEGIDAKSRGSVMRTSSLNALSDFLSSAKG
jgi:hypothetical protein